MRILVAFDKFKDALTAQAACEIARDALRARNADLEIDLCPLTDGGEGFADILTRALQGEVIERKVHGPRGAWVEARYGRVRFDRLSPEAQARLHLSPASDARIAIVDVASASGLELLVPEERNPWLTSTLGTGELLKSAGESTAAAILLGVGGSATNDLGIGALSALGLECISDDGVLTWPMPAEWKRITRLHHPRAFALPPLRIACDVDNPLLGASGATVTFGPQKGLARSEVPLLEAEVALMATTLCRQFAKPIELLSTPGAGAAGGISFGLMAAFGAELIPGAALVSDWLDLPSRIQKADLILTGEGRFDASTLRGKAPGTVARLATELGKRVHVFCGQVDLPEKPGYRVSAISPASMPLAEALLRAPRLLVESITRELQLDWPSAGER